MKSIISIAITLAALSLSMSTYAAFPLPPSPHASRDIVINYGGNDTSSDIRVSMPQPETQMSMVNSKKLKVIVTQPGKLTLSFFKPGIPNCTCTITAVLTEAQVKDPMINLQTSQTSGLLCDHGSPIHSGIFAVNSNNCSNK